MLLLLPHTHIALLALLLLVGGQGGSGGGIPGHQHLCLRHQASHRVLAVAKVNLEGLGVALCVYEHSVCHEEYLVARLPLHAKALHMLPRECLPYVGLVLELPQREFGLHFARWVGGLALR